MRDFGALITWEDGHTTAGVVSIESSPTSCFTIQGAYTYATPGTKYVTVDLYKNDGNGQTSSTATSMTTTVTLTVTDALDVTTLPLAIDDLNNGAEVQVAHFTDSDCAAVSGEFSATLGLGLCDTQCEVVPDGSSGFDVYSSLTSAYAGSTSAISLTIEKTIGNTVVAEDVENLTSLLLDSGSTVVLAGLPSGSNLTVTNGTTLDLDGSFNTLGTVTLADGSIIDGSIYATSYSVQNGTISANLGDSTGVNAPLTMSGDGLVSLTGTNTYTGGTSIEGTGTLAVNSTAATGTVTFTASGTLQRSAISRWPPSTRAIRRTPRMPPRSTQAVST